MTSSVITIEKNIDYSQIEHTYSKKISLFKQLKEEGEYILSSCLGETGIKIHTISSRVKQKDSFLKKVELKQTEKPFEDITDIVGLRVVCLKFKELIFTNFEVISEDDKINRISEYSIGLFDKNT
ncbi:hypothetical protein [Sporosarcina koreensis]|uniref:RelA/SpoT domain-containing protein n=1 Tax=Sporosarcina koreensis TaxID=334735 RepID=A0ABW0TXD7_9BACL